MFGETGILEIAARRGKAADLSERVFKNASILLPDAGWTRSNGLVRVVGFAPQTWLFIAPPKTCAQFETEVSSDLAAVVDQSSGYAQLIFEAPQVERALASNCRLDFDLRAFPVGRAARTLYGQVAVLVWRESDARFGMAVPATLRAAFDASDRSRRS